MGRAMAMLPGVALLAAACGPAPRAGSARRGIVGGADATGATFAPVGALVVDCPGDRYAVCSGTLVAPRVVLTAAHCVASRPTAIPVGFYTGAAVGSARAEEVTPVLAARVHPGYRGANAPPGPGDQRDLALVWLARAHPAAPAALAEGARAAALVRPGTRVVIAGFGRSRAGSAASIGRKRFGRATIAEVSKGELRLARSDGAQKCHGDSGGPSFAGGDLAAGRLGFLVGVAARADRDCAAGSIDTRVDVHAAWIRAGLDDPCARDGGAACRRFCRSHGRCLAGGRCAPAPDGRVEAEDAGEGCATARGGGGVLAFLALAATGIARRRT